MSNKFISASCKGELCKCGKLSAAKISEEIFHDDPNPFRHPLSVYVCEECFDNLMSPNNSDKNKGIT